MAHPNAEKGKRWERAIAAEYPDLKRITRNGEHFDLADLRERVLPMWTIEAKDDQSHPLSRFIRQMLAARERNGDSWGVVLVKKRNAPTRDGYAVMPMWLWNDLRIYLRDLELVRELGEKL